MICASPTIIRMTKSRMRWGRACGVSGDEGKCIQDFSEETLRKKTTGIILKWVLKKQNGNILTEFAWLRTGTSVAHWGTWL